MPYLTRRGNIQRSSAIGHVPVADNVLVQERLRSAYDISRAERVTKLDAGLTVDPLTLGDVGQRPKYLFAFDGSPHESVVRPEYPSTRVLFVQVAGVLTHLDKLLAESPETFVDPSNVKAASDTSILSMVFPGSNVVRKGCRNLKQSWREELYVSFMEREIEGRTLLDTYMALVGDGGGGNTVQIERCASCGNSDVVDVPIAGTRCAACGFPIYPTDKLRVHEEVSEEGTNLTAIGRVMTVAEHLAAVAYASYFESRQATTLGEVAFILDGPLALFGPQAWMRTSLFAFYRGLRGRLEAQGLRPPLVLGIEKSGMVVEHAAALGDLLPPGHLMRLPTAYIYGRIKSEQPVEKDRPFGRDEYYGQKFVYRSRRGQILVFTIPKMESDIKLWNDDPASYPELPRVISLLERIETALYPNAVIPVALAHHFASIPLRTGSRVLTLLAQEALNA